MRNLSGYYKLVTSYLAIGLAAFHLFTGIFGTLPSFQQQAVHVAIAIGLTLMVYPIRKTDGKNDTRIPWWDILFAVLIFISTAYVFINYKTLMLGVVGQITILEMILAVATVLLILEAGRRTIGWVFPVLTALALIYTLWGHYIPGIFGHPPVKWTLVFQFLYLSADGVWGFLTNVSSTYIAVFMMFSAFLLATGGGQTFIDLAIFVAGRFRGGPAKVAVVASGFFGMLSGSAIANVATTGSFTIPLMKKLGYRPEFAGAVEAVASTGGLIMPPVMGVAAFLIAEFLGITYLQVVIAAAIPAFLYFLTVFIGVHLEALRLNLVPIPSDQIPSFRTMFQWRRMVCLFFPIIALIGTLFLGYSLTLVATSGCLASLVAYIFCGYNVAGMRRRLRSIPSIFEEAGNTLVGIVPLIVSASILLFCLSFTGLDLKFSGMITELGKSNVLLSLIMAAILVLILGCGLPATAAYILGVVVAGRQLAAWGITPLAAHLFIMYYSSLANITPPVCPAVYVGAKIASANWIKTGLQAVKLAPLLYIVPFIFVFDTNILLMNTIEGAIWATVTVGIGAFLMIGGINGQFILKSHIIERVLLIVSGLMLLIPNHTTQIVGGILLVVIIAEQLIRRYRGIRTISG